LKKLSKRCGPGVGEVKRPRAVKRQRKSGRKGFTGEGKKKKGTKEYPGERGGTLQGKSERESSRRRGDRRSWRKKVKKSLDQRNHTEELGGKTKI